MAAFANEGDTLSFGVQDNFTSETILRRWAPGFTKGPQFYLNSTH